MLTNSFIKCFNPFQHTCSASVPKLCPFITVGDAAFFLSSLFMKSRR